MVLRTVQRWLIIGFSLIALASCSGDDINDFNDFSEVRLSSLEIVEGGTLFFNGNVVEEFESGNLGPYELRLDDQGTTSISLRAATLQASAELEVVELRRGENGIDRITEFASGETVTVNDIGEGGNTVIVRVSSTENAALSEYVITVRRISTNATLSDFRVQNVFASNPEGNNTNIMIDFDSEITEGVFEYNVMVDQRLCGVEFFPVLTASSVRQITVNGVSDDRSQESFISLQDNVTSVVNVEIISEDGLSTENYTFNISRDLPTEEQMSQDVRLASLDIEQGRVTTAFRCDGTEVLIKDVSTEITDLTLTAVPIREGVTLMIGDAIIMDNGMPQNTDGLLDSENNEPFSPGEPFSGDVLRNLDLGSNNFVLTITSADGEVMGTYRIIINRSRDTEIFVETTEQLQQALRNATPGDTIVVRGGDYMGVPGAADSATGSGNPAAHFFSSVDGTEESPINIRTTNGTVRLLGDDISQNSVLVLAGDFWRISAGVELSGAQNGLVLDGADQALIESLTIDSVGGRGIVLTNGSSNNQVRLGRIDRTGLAPLTRDGTGEVFDEAIVVGEGDGASDSNSIRNMIFGISSPGEAIDIKSTATNTNVQFNIFNSDNTVERPIANRSLLVVDGESTEISYNDFVYNDIPSGSDDFSQLILVNASSNVEIFQNNFDLDTQAINLVNTGNVGAVSVADNVRRDEGDLLYVGNVDESFTTPVFRIRSTLNADNCLSQEMLNITQNETTLLLNLVTVNPCNDSDEQRWRFLVDEQGFIFISVANDSATRASLQLIAPNTANQDAISLLRTNNDSVFDDAFINNWLLLFGSENVSFTNRSSATGAGAFRFLIEEPTIMNDDFEDSGRILRIGAPTIEGSGTFTLERL